MTEIRLFYLLAGLLVLELILGLILRFLVKPRQNELLNQDLVSDPGIKPVTLYSQKYGIAGKPDEIRNISGELIPAEHKSTVWKGRVYPSHIMQLAAYCLLIEENTGRRPPYGIIRYKNHEEQVPYTKELRSSLLTRIKQIRQESPEEKDLPPVCENTRRCAHCGYARYCHTGQKKLF